MWMEAVSRIKFRIQNNYLDTSEPGLWCQTSCQTCQTSYKCGQLKFCSRSPSRYLNMEFSFSSNLSDDFNLLMKSAKNHSHNKLNRKQQLLWLCFAFIARNMGQNTATKSFSSQQMKTLQFFLHIRVLFLLFYIYIWRLCQIQLNPY